MNRQLIVLALGALLAGVSPQQSYAQT